MLKSFLFIIISACMLNGSNLYAQEKNEHCNDSDVVVTYTETEDYQLVCDSVNRVIEIVKKIGLNTELKINISILDKLAFNSTAKLLALFNPNTMEVQVLSMAACKQTFGTEVIFGLEIDKELHKSIIIHEIAHALFWKNKGDKVIPREIHEYFAYAIQLNLLDHHHRDKIISRNKVQAYTDMSEISEEYYLMSPVRFAVKSYLHFKNAEPNWSYLLELFQK